MRVSLSISLTISRSFASRTHRQHRIGRSLCKQLSLVIASHVSLVILRSVTSCWVAAKYQSLVLTIHQQEPLAPLLSHHVYIHTYLYVYTYLHNIYVRTLPFVISIIFTLCNTTLFVVLVHRIHTEKVFDSHDFKAMV